MRTVISTLLRFQPDGGLYMTLILFFVGVELSLTLKGFADHVARPRKRQALAMVYEETAGRRYQLFRLMVYFVP